VDLKVDNDVSAENGDSMFLRKGGMYLQGHTPLQPRRLNMTVSEPVVLKPTAVLPVHESEKLSITSL
jgi:hypothetical protein